MFRLLSLTVSCVLGVHVSRAHSHHADVVLLKELVAKGRTVWRGRQGKHSLPNGSWRLLTADTSPFTPDAQNVAKALPCWQCWCDVLWALLAPKISVINSHLRPSSHSSFPSPQGVPEDLLFFYQSIRQGGGVARVDQCLLVYRYHEKAATHSVAESVTQLQFPHTFAVDLLCAVH